MNKRIFSLLLVLAMLFTVAPIAAATEEATETVTFDPASFVCPHCGGEAVEWTDLSTITVSTSAENIETGHYYVSADGLTTEASINWDDSHTYRTVCLYLAGDMTTSGTAFALSAGAVVNLMGTGTLYAGAEAYTTSGSGTAKIYVLDNVTIKRAPESTSTEPLVKLQGKNYDFYLQDNAVIDGEAANRCVLLTRGDLIIEGGAIQNGSATTQGGNIRQHGGTIKMTGGEIKDGATTVTTYTESDVNYVAGGGNIASVAGTCTISGGTVSGGTAKYNGGSIWAFGTAVVNISGTAAISGGTASTSALTYAATADATEASEHTGGGAIALSNGATLNISGGTIAGTKATNGGTILVNNATVNHTAGVVSAPAANGGTRGGCVYAMGTAEYNMGGTASMVGSTVGYTNGGCIQLAGATLNLNAGATLTGGKTSSTSTTNGTGGGNLYNGGTVNMYDGATITGGTGDATCGGNIHNKGGTFNMYGGTISNGTVGGGFSGNVHVNGGKFNMYGGTITGGVSNNNGGNIQISSGTFTLHDGIISNGTAKNYGGNVIRNGGNFNAEGGTITGGKGSAGGNIFLLGGTSNIRNVVITDGIATATSGDSNLGGGNVMARSGTNNFYDCHFIATDDTTNTAKGGNLFVRYGATVTLDGCYLKAASAAAMGTQANGRNVYVDSTADAVGTLNLKDTLVLTAKSGNTLYSSSNAKVTVDGLTFVGQLYQPNLTGNVTVKAGFIGDVVLRYTDSTTIGTYTTANIAMPAVLVAEAGYTGLGNIEASAGASGNYFTALNEDGTGFVTVGTKYSNSGRTGTINLFHGYAADTNGYRLFYYDDAQAALDAYAAANSDRCFVRLTKAEEALTYGGTNNLLWNLNGYSVASLTVNSDTAEIQVWDNAGKGNNIGTVTGGTIPAYFYSADGEAVYVPNGSRTNLTSHLLSVSTKAYLRTSKETLAFQGLFSLNKASAGAITEIGVKLYKADGTEIAHVIYDDTYEFTAEALNDLKSTGAYNAARVAIESEGDANNWWEHDITAVSYVILAGETFESEAVTVNYKAAVEAQYNNADNHETVKNMIDNTTHEGAYEGWNLVVPEVEQTPEETV